MVTVGGWGGCPAPYSRSQALVRANPNPRPTDKGGMDTTYAERVTQANLTIQELISALAEVQKLIASHNKDCHLGLITGEKLGTAYYRLAEKLSQALLFC